MSKNKVVKSVSFNITDQQDQLYLERIRDINFSGYVKKLIEKDIRSRKIIKPNNTPHNPPVNAPNNTPPTSPNTPEAQTTSPEAHNGHQTGTIIIKGGLILK